MRMDFEARLPRPRQASQLQRCHGVDFIYGETARPRLAFSPRLALYLYGEIALLIHWL